LPFIHGEPGENNPETAGRLVVLAVNGVDPRRMEAIADSYLDDLLCRG